MGCLLPNSDRGAFLTGLNIFSFAGISRNIMKWTHDTWGGQQFFLLYLFLEAIPSEDTAERIHCLRKSLNVIVAPRKAPKAI